MVLSPLGRGAFPHAPVSGFEQSATSEFEIEVRILLPGLPYQELYATDEQFFEPGPDFYQLRQEPAITGLD